MANNSDSGNDVVQAKGSFATSIGGATRIIHKGQTYRADDPIVKANPTRFGALTVSGVGAQPSASVAAAARQRARTSHPDGQANSSRDADPDAQGTPAAGDDGDQGTASGKNATSGDDPAAIAAGAGTDDGPNATSGDYPEGKPDAGGLSDSGKAHSDDKADAASDAGTPPNSSLAATLADGDALDDKSRAELNAIATAAGVEGADTLPNKAAVVDAINAKAAK